MPILVQQGPLCGKALPDELAQELGIRAKLACMLAEDHGPAPDCLARLVTPKWSGQVVWRADISFIPLVVPPDVEHCVEVLPEELADALEVTGAGWSKLRCALECQHRGACIALPSKRATVAWWPRREADE